MEFQTFKKVFQKHFEDITKEADYLFRVNVEPDILWETYLGSFPPGSNEIYRERGEMDCSNCRHFVKRFGNIAVINPETYEMVTVWDFIANDDVFSHVTTAMSNLLHSKMINEANVTKEKKHGVDCNHEMISEDEVIVWNHLYIELPKRFVLARGEENALRGERRDNRNVFIRSLEEISPEAIDTVLELVEEKLLYRGEEWVPALILFKRLQETYCNLEYERQRNNFGWLVAQQIGGSISRIRNHSIGTLLIDLSEGVDIEAAVAKFRKVMDPHNYQHSKPIFTKRMVDEALKTATELGILNSLGRQHAQIGDITINNVLWANRDAVPLMDGAGGLFEALKQDIAINPKDYENIPSIGIQEFWENVLPRTEKIEVLLENRLSGNLVSLIGPKDPDAISMFKWGSPFSWAYNGNITDSTMKERVKELGGKIDGDLRFTIQWNENGDNPNDYDAHCKSREEHIYFQNKGRTHQSSGMLDVDIVNPNQQCPGKPAVENIVFADRYKMPPGPYDFFVDCYSHRGGISGFAAEIEFDGELYSFRWAEDFHGVKVVATVHWNGKEFSIRPRLPEVSSISSKEIWNLKTNQFHPVSVFMFSPNYWDWQDGLGNRHYFFMLANCLNPDSPSGFFNEYLHEDLRKHRKVFEALSNKTKVEYSDQQLSGVGFSSTQRNSVVLKVNDRPIRLVF